MVSTMITLILDNEVLDKYSKHYFELHPKARKVPIKEPYHPSINAWFILRRPELNALKQKWKDFVVWWIEDLGYTNKQLNNCKMKFTVYFSTKRRHDVDNQVPKFILDGFTEAGFIVDDDESHLTELTLTTGYDKNNPRTVIEIENCDGRK